MPITVRYGPAGQLVQAAEDIGEGQARQRQKQIDLQRVGQVRDHYAQQDEARRQVYEAQLEQERARMEQELQQAKLAQQARRARQAPTAGSQRRQDTPLDQETRDAADRFREQYQPPEEADTGYGAVRGPGGRVTATGEDGIVTGPGGEEVRQRGGEPAQRAVQGLDQQQGGGFVMGQGGQQPGQADSLKSAKQSLARMMGAQQLPEEQLQGIQQAIENPEIGPDEFGVRVNQALNRAGKTQQPPGELTDQQREAVQYYEDQMDAAQEQERLILENDAPAALGQVMPQTEATSLAAEYAQAESKAGRQEALKKFKQRLAQSVGVDASYGPGVGSMDQRIKAVENQYDRAIREFKALADVQKRKQTAQQKRLEAAGLAPGQEGEKQTGGGQQGDSPDQNADPLGIR